LEPFLELWTTHWRADVEELWGLGQDSEDASRFNMAGFCLNTSGAANGVSELHGEVSRRLFSGVGIGDRIGHVTNGVHARTWTARHIQTMFDDVLGPTWSEGDPDAWVHVADLDSDRVGKARASSSLLLSSYVSSELGHSLDPGALVIGFARRFVPYKRATLFMSDLERLETLLQNDEHPVQFVFAGKAHPNDQSGKSIVSELVRFSKSKSANGRVLFIPDYNMDVGHAMVKGSDIWLNNPVRHREASGTSGEKVALNGGLNLSILDGWWAEMYDGSNGWEIRTSDSADPLARDAEESGWLLDALENVVDEYFGNRDRFHQRIIHAWATLGPKVTAARMVEEYDRKYYQPALSRNR
jgi:starch phosphorylase